MLAAAVTLAGCASTNPRDPFEQFNRAMFRFNDAVDQAAVKPAAEVYSTLPTFVQIGVGNFFGNLEDGWTAVNNLLQGKLADGMSDVMRFTFNSTFGLGGLLDIGTEAGLPKHREDFGQTLGKWGVKPGPYIVLPILGSSTLRDVVAIPVDAQGDLWYNAYPVRVRNFGAAVRVIDQRAIVLDASNLVEEAALDRYQFVRDGYLQRRQSKVYDGDPPETSYEFDIGPSSMDESGVAEQSPVKGEQKATSAEPDPKPVVKVEQGAGSGADAGGVAKEVKQ
ncbi:MAG TPA: VacJ family lipoprotein [Noviherbaspirillum sp.]|uniref:MlaA family lipoprotein n=1 Tax=Noviherbaspirillum sp. TaxID=1926288 RepID=UPI002D26FFFC|nr:VacJ family lipoprotein [Noviherbaspirillum sp.]HYD94250.1 VacJ family lipoprotein [Noviherbaspirillum sp.]